MAYAPSPRRELKSGVLKYWTTSALDHRSSGSHSPHPTTNVYHACEVGNFVGNSVGVYRPALTHGLTHGLLGTVFTEVEVEEEEEW